VGREANAQYGETLSGVQVHNSIHHQLVKGVSARVDPDDPNSPWLPTIDPDGPGNEGDGDHRVQAYCYRMCLTTHPENRIPFAKPDGYDPLDYELLLRNYEAGAKHEVPWINSPMPNRKTDTNNRLGFSTDFIGQNYDYPEADYDTREQIAQRHRKYQQGLMWTLANHPRIPAAVRGEASRWGTCRDEFERADGWQGQLYIREARRMIGAHVMTQHHCQGREVAARPIGMAAYTMDSHNVQRYADADGMARNEGDVQVGGFPPYPIDYHSILPQANECDNLLVPVCLSATHMAFGSIRMEPVFMVLGQSAATAAMQSINTNTPLHEIPYDTLKGQLLADNQVLSWKAKPRPEWVSVDPKSLKGIVIDDPQADAIGFSGVGTTVAPWVGESYRHDGNASKGDQTMTYHLEIPADGEYQVRMAWSGHANRDSAVPVTIHHQGGSTTVRVDQSRPPKEPPFETIGTFTFAKGKTSIVVSNRDTTGYVTTDAMQLIAQ
ncbi:MAG: FAD-dependent oxidoreductase, partial [Planctomycetota bacterium]